MMYYIIEEKGELKVIKCYNKQVFFNTLCIILDGEIDFTKSNRTIQSVFYGEEIFSEKDDKGMRTFYTKNKNIVWKGMYAYYEEQQIEELVL